MRPLSLTNGEHCLSTGILIKNIFQKTTNTAEARDKIELFLFAFVSALIILGINSNVFTFAAAIILGVFILCSNLEQQFEALFFFLSFSNIFKISFDGSSLFTYLQLIPIFAFFVKNGLSFKINGLVQCVFLIFLATLATFISNSSFALFFKFIIMCIFLLQTKKISRGRLINYKRIILAFSIGVIVAGIVGVFKDYIPGLTKYVSNVYYRLSNNDDLDISNRFSGLTENPNYYSIDIIIAISALLILYRDKEIKYCFFLLTFLLTVLGILTQSKAFVLSLAIIVLYFLYLKVKSAKYFETILILILLCLVGYLAFRHLGILSDYAARFFSVFDGEFDLNSITTGRMEIWTLYSKEIFSNVTFVFVGRGIDAISSQIGMAPHNVFIQGIYDIGLIGSILYYSFIFSLFGKKTFSVAFPILACLFARFMGANIMFYMNTFYYYLLIILLTNSKRGVRNEKNNYCNTKLF